MDKSSMSEDLLGLHVCAAFQCGSTGPAIGCQALTSALGANAGGSFAWTPAWIDLCRGTVRLREGHEQLGIVSHEFTSGVRIYLRFPGRQYYLKLKGVNRLSEPALAHLKRSLRGAASIEAAHA